MLPAAISQCYCQHISWYKAILLGGGAFHSSMSVVLLFSFFSQHNKWSSQKVVYHLVRCHLVVSSFLLIVARSTLANIISWFQSRHMWFPCSVTAYTFSFPLTRQNQQWKPPCPKAHLPTFKNSSGDSQSIATNCGTEIWTRRCQEIGISHSNILVGRWCSSVTDPGVARTPSSSGFVWKSPGIVPMQLRVCEWIRIPWMCGAFWLLTSKNPAVASL